MKKRALFLCGLLFTVGCSRADVEVLGRIGQRVEKKVEVVWKTEPSSKLLKSLPLLQQPEPGIHEETPDGRVPPRLNVK